MICTAEIPGASAEIPKAIFRDIRFQRKLTKRYGALVSITLCELAPKVPSLFLWESYKKEVTQGGKAVTYFFEINKQIESMGDISKD